MSLPIVTQQNGYGLFMMTEGPGIVEPWVFDAFRAALRTSGSVLDSLSVSASSPVLDDPEKLRYIKELIACILNGRTIVASYNIVLALSLVLWSLCHFWRTLRQRQRWTRLEQGYSCAGEDLSNSAEDPADGVLQCAEGSVRDGSLSSADTAIEPDRLDLERQPLLKSSPRHHVLQASRDIPFTNYLRYLLLYQPRPVPLIHRALPSNGTSLIVVAYWSLNIFFHLYRLPLLEPRFFFAFADRAGLVFVVNLPLLYLLSAKNQPLKVLTGCSYEALNIYHRRVGEWMCFEAFVHVSSMIIWRFCLSPSWLLRTNNPWDYFTHPLILRGLGAFASYELLFFTSLASVRMRWYECFLATHIFLQAAALAFLWLHFPTSRPYVYFSLAVIVIDRLLLRLRLKRVAMTADLEILEDGHTIMLSANWELSKSKLNRTVLGGWEPADHVFLSVPNLGRTHTLQSHPFTIASAAPERISGHAWLNLLIRAHSGFTADILEYAKLHSRVPVRLDGPYGSSEALDMLRASDRVIIVAGGSGIAVAFPLLSALVTRFRGRRQINLLWIIHQSSQRCWLPEERLVELRQAGVNLTIPQPTVEAGRPDVASYLSNLTSLLPGKVGIVSSGPDTLNRSVTNITADAVKAGVDVQLRIEKFGW
ncbi:hypothetical protein F4778DRAFT_756636 [Xylariomycetidae sp. FL2044]|nr:hypothetical protein F4778DRAFT_756636 [Xylariomycetidae sp. FL2044]